MLFDLQGKRRRVVQATYLMLAVLMGGGLVLFGIGGDVSGGLFDAFSDRSGGGGNSDVIEERVERNEQRVRRRPRDAATRAELVRDYYSLAFSQTPEDAAAFSQDARDELNHASTHWRAYLDLKRKPDPAVARVALQLYDPTALNQPGNALKAARVIAERGNDPGSYLQLVQYAQLAKDVRTEKLATRKALDLTRNAQERKAVRDELKRIKQQAIARQIQQGDIKLDTSAPQGGKQQGGKQQGGTQPGGSEK
jgi:hypothetical protein